MGWDPKRLVFSYYRPYVTPREAFWSMLGGPLFAATAIFVLGMVTSWTIHWWWWVLVVAVGYQCGHASSSWMIRRARTRMRHERID